MSLFFKKCFLSSTATSLFYMRRYIFFLSFLSAFFTAFSQVDVTKYVSSDLFEVKPVITKDFIGENEVAKFVETTNSWFETEIQKGFDLWYNGSPDDAVEVFEQLSEELPEIAMLDYYIGLIEYDREHYDEAIEYFNKALKKDPLLLETRYYLGLIALENKKIKEAKKNFKILLSVPAYSAFGYNGMAVMALSAGNIYKSYNMYKKCLDVDSTFMEAYLPMISIDMFYGKLKRALKVVEQGISIQPDWQEGIMVRGILALLQHEDTAQFEKDIDHLIQLAPDNYHYYLMRGYLQIELRQFHQAIENFRLAYDLQVDSVKTGEFKFSTKVERSEVMQRSLNYYHEQFAMDPEVRKYVDRGICEAISGNNQKALVLLDSASQLDDNAVIHTFKGAVYKTRKKNAEAIKAYSKAIEFDSLHWAAYLYRANLYMGLSHFDSAYNDFERVIHLKPKRKEGYKNRGIIHFNNQYFNRAYKDFSIGLGIDPTDNDLYFNRALAAMNMGYYKEAEHDLYRIIKNKPQDGEAYYYLHTMRLNQHDTLGAIIYLDSASKNSKYKVDYHKELFELAYTKSQTETCISAYNRLVKYSWNSRYLLKRGRYFIELGKYSEAIKDLNKYLKKKKDSGEAYYFLGQAQQKTNQEKAARKSFKKATRLGYEPSFN